MTVGSPLSPAAPRRRYRRLPHQRLLGDGAVTGGIGAGVSDGTPGVEERGREGVGKGEVSAGRALRGPKAAPASSRSSAAASKAAAAAAATAATAARARSLQRRAAESSGAAAPAPAEPSRAERSAQPGRGHRRLVDAITATKSSLSREPRRELAWKARSPWTWGAAAGRAWRVGGWGRDRRWPRRESLPASRVSSTPLPPCPIPLPTRGPPLQPACLHPDLTKWNAACRGRVCRPRRAAKGNLGMAASGGIGAGVCPLFVTWGDLVTNSPQPFPTPRAWVSVAPSPLRVAGRKMTLGS